VEIYRHEDPLAALRLLQALVAARFQFVDERECLIDSLIFIGGFAEFNKYREALFVREIFMALTALAGDGFLAH